MSTGYRPKRINGEAYNALVDTLASVYFNKMPFERFLQVHLQDAPELLAGLITGSDTKRQVADELIARLSRNEEKYQALTLELMQCLADFSDWSNLRRHEDGERLLREAHAAQEVLKRWVHEHSELAAAQRKVAEEQETDQVNRAAKRSFDASLENLKSELVELEQLDDHQARGLLVESLLARLFALHDLAPRNAFRLQHEQIDGAFTFNTDDYIVEAKWQKSPCDAADLHILSGKVEKRAKNTLGLFVSIRGFTAGAVEAYSHGTSLILMDGYDLYAVLDGRIDLRELLDRKRRHAAETGNPFLSAAAILADT